MGENIFLFVPNIIGYVRIILGLVSFYYMPHDYRVASFCYLLSGLLDAFDGHAARFLNQGTKFGAMLDMLTDRCSTMCLVVTLSLFYPHFMFIFQVSMCLDIASHWIHMHSQTMKGDCGHKKIDLSENWILHHYYTKRVVLFTMCAGNELFHCMLYLLYFTSGPIINFGLFSVGVYSIVCVLTAPIALVKACISVVHLYTACVNIAVVDCEERQKAAANTESIKKQ